MPEGKSPTLTIPVGEGEVRGEIRKIGRKGGMKKNIPNGLDFLILYYSSKGVPPTNPVLKKALGRGWSVKPLLHPNDHKKEEVLRNFGKFYQARRDLEKVPWKEINLFESLKSDIKKFIDKDLLDKEDLEKPWRLIGDETFEKMHKILRYIWVIVPPGAGLPPALGFHAKDSGPEETKMMVKRLIAKADPSRSLSERVQIHLFDGPAEIGGGKEEYPTRILPDTLPVMMDAIRSAVGFETSKGLSLQILIEGYSSKLAQAGEVTPLVRVYDDRAAIGHAPDFLAELMPPKRFQPKDGHPLLAYPDAVGVALKEGDADMRDDLDPLVQKWTFEEAKILTDGLLNTSSPNRAKGFYRHLRDLPTADHPNLSKKNRALVAIVEHYSALLAGQLSVTDFLEFEKSSRDVPNYRWASERMIEDRGGIDAWIAEIPSKAYRRRFDAHFTGFSYASRGSDSASMMKHSAEIDELRRQHDSELDGGRIRDFARVLEAELHTMFMFTKDDKAAALLDDSESRLEKVAADAFDANAEDRHRHYLGARIQREAFRDGPQISDRALELQRELRDAEIESEGERAEHRKRHTTYLLEMLLDRSRIDPTALNEAEDIRRESAREEGGPDEWRLATLMKLGVTLQENGDPLPGAIADLIPQLPSDEGSDGNPNIRCMAWGARLCHILGMGDSRLKFVNAIRSKAERALAGEEDPYKDAMGLTHACHIIDLERHDWGRGTRANNMIGEDYLKLVLEKSWKTTRDWFAENEPTEEDPLRPLNFQYR